MIEESLLKKLPPLAPPIHKRVHLDDIDVGDRAREEYGDLHALAQDITQYGLHHNLVLLSASHREDSEKPLLLAGGRRHAASKLALSILDPETARPGLIEELSNPQCKIYDRPLSEDELYVIELHENLLRLEMTDYEEMKLIAKIHRRQQKIHGKSKTSGEGWSLKKTAEKVNSSVTSVQRAVETVAFIKKNPELETVAEEATKKGDLYKIVEDAKKQAALEEYNRRQEARIQAEKEKGIASQKELLSRRYIVGDFFEEIEKLEDRTFDFVELDPDWGISFKETQETFSEQLDLEEYHEIPPEEYVETAERIFTEAHRVMKDHAWGIVWYSVEEWHKETKDILEKVGFNVCPRPAIWIHRQRRTATPAYRMSQCYETFFYIRKGSPRLKKMGRDDYFQYRSLRRSERFHPAAKPIELYNDIFATFLQKGQSVLVGFAGEGNAILAGHNLGLQVVGFDKSEKFAEKFKAKVFMGNGQTYRSYKDE